MLLPQLNNTGYQQTIQQERQYKATNYRKNNKNYDDPLPE
jgi:hypothetical protein